MGNKIDNLSKLYAKSGETISNDIQRTLVKYETEILEVTPTSICFLPWSACNSNSCELLRGTILWNPINLDMKIHYNIQLTLQNNNPSYSHCLKWYLTKWNEQRTKPMTQLSLKFIYPGNTNSEIILQARSKINRGSFDRQIRMLLILFNNIIKKESVMISSIITGNISLKLKQAIFDEITMLLTEIDGTGGLND